MNDRTTDDVARWLTEIPELVALLPDAAVTHAPHGEGTRSVAGPRVPTNLDVLHLLDVRTKGEDMPDPDRVGVLPYLDSWARDLEATALDERPTPPEFLPEVPTVANTVQWLLGELEWAATLPQWPEMADGIRRTHKALRLAVRGVREAPQRPVPCVRCENPLTAVEGTVASWECRACGHQVSVQAVTLRQAASILRDDLGKAAPTLRTLQRWALRPGILAPIADGPRKRMFDMGQIRKLAAEERMREIA